MHWSETPCQIGLIYIDFPSKNFRISIGLWNLKTKMWNVWKIGKFWSTTKCLLSFPLNLIFSLRQQWMRLCKVIQGVTRQNMSISACLPLLPSNPSVLSVNFLVYRYADKSKNPSQTLFGNKGKRDLSWKCSALKDFKKEFGSE